MITELTEEQKKLIPFYVDKWAKIGLSCGPVKDYEETINLFYEKILNKKRPTEIILAPSPLQVFELMGNQIDQSVWGQVWIRVWVQVENQVRKQVGKHVLEQVWMQVLEQVRKQVWQVYLNDGRLDFRIFPFYDYFNQVLDIQYPDAWSIFKKKEIELGFVYALFDDICILSDRPEQISIKDGVLHNESGMAIKYRDRWGVYMLNGVRVTKEIAETPADKLDPEILLKETNAEVRREIVRKIGVERLEKKLKPHVLDKWGDYELHDYSNHFKMFFRPVYLKMKNLSIGVWHYEGVNIRQMEAPTCQAALKWRLKGKEFKPIRIS